MNLTDYCAEDALGLAGLIARKEVAPADVIAAAKAALRAINPTLNAVIETYDAELDRPDTARLGDGPFRGVPFLIKDVGQHFAGRRVEYGSRLCRGMTVAADDFFGTQVLASGVLPIGRSNTPEFSMALCADNLLYGATSNPWRLGYSTNGSSGGAAAAVAAGIVPIAHASDMGGSTRGPAAWCGTVGLQPSRGRVSAGPAFAERGNGMAQSFVVTRTIRDTAAMLDGVSLPQPGDPFVIARPPRPYLDYTAPGETRYRIAWSTAPLMDAPVDAEVAAAVERTARVLADAGHHVEEAAPPLDLPGLDRACTDVWYYGFDQYLDALAARNNRTVGPDTVERATLRFYEFAKRRAVADYFAALDAFNRIRRTVGPFFQHHDVWLTPTCAKVAQPNGVFGMNIDVAPEDFLVHEQRPCQFMILANVTGQPALSLPLAMHSSGLPIGVQLMARPAEEHVLIALGAALERDMPWHHRRPPLHAAAVA